MDIRIYNTLTDKKEKLEAVDSRSFLSFFKKKKINMFVCGPTVYDYIHIGNARTFVNFDLIASYLKKRGYDVNYLQNITDIDDKIINRAKEEGIKPKDLAERFTKEYFEDIKKLNIDSVDNFALASEHIDEIFKQIKTLIKKEYAYVVPSIAVEGPDAVNDMNNKDVYFDVSKFKDYGKLSKQKIEEQETGTRINTQSNKKEPQDFVLWKAQNYTYEPSWSSPWGMGRPGWHIEDTAISEKYLGQQYEIHCGGLDLKFPHHEAEIAQQEAASGKKPFVKYWLHSGLLTVNGEKMSKSLNNFITAREALKEYSTEVLRFFMINAHYRSPLDYSAKNLRQAESTLNRLIEFKEELLMIKPGSTNPEAVERLAKLKDEFSKFMDDDFNVPGALAVLFDFIKEMNLLIAVNKLGKENAKDILEFIDKIDSFLKIIPEKEEAPQEVIDLVSQREHARTDKDFEKADELRKKIEKMGYIVKDTPSGPQIRKK